MIQCVGSRNTDRPYCSRICCSVAIKNALRIKDLYPDSNVYILYRDIRTYGLKEKYYYQAGERGIRFIRFDDERNPEVGIQDDKSISVKIFDNVLGEKILLKPDLLVLSSAMLPQPDNEVLA